MSEPIRTVEQLVQACKDLTLSSVLALKHCQRSGLSGEVSLALSLVPENAHHANRIIDYLGLDYCRDGETPRERIERERKDTDTLLGLLGAEKRRAEAASRRLARYHDLVRYARAFLHDEHLISDDEYADLVTEVESPAGHGAVSRLEGYAANVQRIAALEAERDRYRDALVRVTAWARKLRCLGTGNPCGTDTHFVGMPCRCCTCAHFAELRQFLIAAGLDPDTLGVE